MTNPYYSNEENYGQIGVIISCILFLRSVSTIEAMRRRVLIKSHKSTSERQLVPLKKGYRTDKGGYNRKAILTNTNAEIEKLNFELSKLNIKKRSIKKEIIEAELDCPLSETFGIEVDKISNAENFISALNRENILHTLKTKNDGRQIIFFANRDKEKVSDIFNANNLNKSVKKHHSR